MKANYLPSLRGKVTTGFQLSRELTKAISEIEVRALRAGINAATVANRGALVSYLTAAAAQLANPTATPALSPATGPVAGGTTVTITGTGLRQLRSVTVDGVAATNIVSNPNGTSATFVTPARTAGAKNVIITNLFGSVTKTGAFTYV